jgi:hypothetical protein
VVGGEVVGGADCSTALLAGGGATVDGVAGAEAAGVDAAGLPAAAGVAGDGGGDAADGAAAGAALAAGGSAAVGAAGDGAGDGRAGSTAGASVVAGRPAASGVFFLSIAALQILWPFAAPCPALAAARVSTSCARDHRPHPYPGCLLLLSSAALPSFIRLRRERQSADDAAHAFRERQPAGRVAAFEARPLCRYATRRSVGEGVCRADMPRKKAMSRTHRGGRSLFEGGHEMAFG